MRKIIDRIRSVLLGALVRGNRERGMATAEYAVGTVAVVTVGSVLYRIISDPVFQQAIWQLIQWLLDLIMKIVTG